MVKGILSDLNVRGQLNKLVHLLRNGEWQELWESLQLDVVSLADFGLADTDSDAAIWRVCQPEQLILFTANRNKDEPDSLEAIIRACNTVQSLPVLTLARPKDVMVSSTFAERVAVRMLEYLLDIEKLRGTGRLYLP